ncbi:calcium channel-like protein subunit Cch1 [Lindgomyces ingoldianus]|uniref:Calcium channel-like protein subunit Cch1 n=1 Tax=Lindgomyces ingoldianus TaxID=673940 RepID=A0ACB6QYP3_9PLEO|nr:calcium channel-like protein subunit Cch1 [Lindgomyces ingoldianus]KAF2472109.1 calcium channel-like protein subunit Cch1 [Lindgomyces ingoldianus]
MASSDPDHGRNNTNPQSIPLQDLNRPPDEQDHYATGGAQQHRRTLSDRGRNLLRQTGSIATGQHWNPQYAPIAEASPSPTRTATRPQLNTSIPAGHGGTTASEDGGYSPLEDGGAFQAAIGFGFGGMDFQGNTSPPLPTPMSSEQSYPPHHESDPYVSRQVSEDHGYFAPSAYDDTARLTDERNLQPISGAAPTTPTAQERSSFQSVRFLTPDAVTPASTGRLGDDLSHVEVAGGGLRTSTGRKRSLSPSAAESPLHRAGTIMRNMSQRVVNLSNEPEIAERTMRRKSSLRHARLHEPPSFPALPEYLHDGPSSPTSPVEKPPSPIHLRRPSVQWQPPPNPLRGKTLGIFPPDSKLRLKLCDLLVHPVVEPFLLLLIVIQTILLAVDSSRSVFDHPRSSSWGSTWIDYALLVLFFIYTAEIIIRVIVSGLIINAVEYSSVNRQLGLRDAVLNKVRQLFGPQRQSSLKHVGSSFDPQQPSVLRTLTTAQMTPAIGPGDSRQQQRIRLAHRAYLRHSFNRTDFVAVVSFWIAFAIGVLGAESRRHVFIFKMLSCLRIIRLLNLTSGTSVILRSLKKAAPLLVNVAFLISFFWLLFAIVGVQSFKSSFRRNCVWIDPDGKKNFTNIGQACGGHLKNGTDQNIAENYILANGNVSDTHKGFLCPKGSVCMELSNPHNGTQSFDNIFQSLELVFVIMSSNTYSDLLYHVADSDYLVGALFFAAAIVIMSLWLINLLIAVITSSFQVIREESKASAFTGEEMEEEEVDGLPKQRVSALKRLYGKTGWIWVVVIAYGLIVQSLRSATMSDSRQKFIDLSETGVTLILLIDIILRFVSDWRHFFQSKRNITDLMIAIITTVIQIPVIKNAHDGRAYAWLTIFQVLRIYRVVLAVPMTRDLIMIVLGNVSGLLNLILFVFLLVFLASIFAAQLFRGEIIPQPGETVQISFFTIYNSFLGMYQILSSENWTTILYNVTSYEKYYNTSWIGASFCILWFIFANFIVLNMFIAVIQENFDVSEDEKRLQQVKAFLQKKEQGISSSYGNLSLSSIFKLGQATGRRKDPLDYGSAAAEMLLKDAVVRDFLDEPENVASPNGEEPQPGIRPMPTIVGSGTVSTLWQRLMRKLSSHEPNPFYAPLDFGRAYEDLDPRRMAKEVVSATEKRKKAQREYLRTHPNYNVSLFIFRPNNPIRKICQRIVGPGRGGDRIEGVAPSVPVWYAFSAFIYAAIIAMVLLACVTTPLYQRTYFMTHTFSVKNWFVFTDMGFALLFTVEALIKVIADGFFFTPNAYFRGSWGFIDGVVLVTLWVNVATSLYNEGQITRTVGAFKALRALRLLNISDSARDHFHSVIVRGVWKVISAAFVSLSLLIPFAIYGLNLFVGRMQACNDDGSNISNLADCVNEYASSPFDWNVLAPRQAANPYFDFDNFGNSLFILFQIVSQEGWIDVSWAAQSITGVFTQPAPFASQGNAVFFVVFNLLGAVFVLTLFVSVFMRNYTEQTGVAFLTTDQRSWLELRKLLRQVSPSKRPSSTKQRETWEEWCYRRAVRKTGHWQRFITGLLILHLILLCLEWYPGNSKWDRARDFIFLFFTIIFITNVVIRIIGLSWHRFRKSSWDIFSIFAVSGTFITSILLITNFNERVYTTLHKLCLVSIALLLIPRNNQLDQLFKTAAASLAAIANLLATWFVLFLVYAIALTQTFGLTRFGPGETGNINFRDVPKALILLFRTSTGEGWNQIMEDFAGIRPPFCTIGERYFDSDCGSPDWARALFITWNIISMYLFVNLFVSLIYESFSYVYQRSSGLSVISREEIRRFKQAWAEFDPNGTGYISREAFPRLLGELSGVFEMRIYDGDFTVRRLIEDCSSSRRTSELPVQGHEPAPEIDIKKLNQRLALLPVEGIRVRRQRMNTFYEEVLVSSDPDRGIAFTSLLMILAHYKVINDNKSLRLEEFLRRRARLQRVEEAVRRNVVVGFFDTLYWARRFRRAMEQKSSGRMTAVPQFTVPEIFVDDEDITDAQRGQYSASGSPLFSPADLRPMDDAEWRASGNDVRSPSPPTEMTLRSRANSIQMTPQHSPTRPSPLTPAKASPQMSPFSPPADGDWQFASALSRPPSPLEPDPGPAGNRSRQNSSVSAADVLEVLDNSAWGESIRRSFTMRRSGGR